MDDMIGQQNDTYVVVNDFSKGCKTVGGARSVRDDFILGLVSVKVDTANEPGWTSVTETETEREQLTWGHQRKEPK